MTPEQKAKQLYDKFKPLVSYYDRGSEEPVNYEPLNNKACKYACIICINQIIEQIITIQDRAEYWQEVLDSVNNF